MSDEYDPLLNLPPPDMIALVPGWLAHAAQVLPVGLDENRVVLATVDPDTFAIEHFDRLRFVLNRDIRLITAPRAALAFALWRCYGSPTPPPPVL